jgi:Glycosyl hydrolases family 43/Chitobiase/beta-hexosaminidase C-terminal domain
VNLILHCDLLAPSGVALIGTLYTDAVANYSGAGGLFSAVAVWVAVSCLSAATGSVVYTGPTLGTGGSYGTALSAVFDRDLTTEWITQNPTGGWAGTDFGAASPLQLTAYRVAAGIVGYSGHYNRLAGAQVQASNDCTFTSGVVTLDTVPDVPFPARYNLSARNQRPIAPGAAYRCYRWLSSSIGYGGYGGISELQWIGPAGGSSASARPVMPLISPGAGAYLSGSVQIVIATPTTSAQIYYTTDGSTPTNGHGTLYDRSFTLSVGPKTVLQAVAYDASLDAPLSDVAIGRYRNYAFKANDDWYDDEGILIEAHSADISNFNGRYYWVGQFANKGNIINDIDRNQGVWMYSSVDLLNWHFEGQILDNGQSAGTSWSYVERPHILYNPTTHVYVLWAHMDNNHDATDRAGVATAPNPTGPWTWQTVTLDPDGGGFKDFDLFQDADGTAYVAYVTQTGTSQGPITISQLAGDYQSSTGKSVKGLATGQEAPVLFKRSGVYFLITSGSDYYDSVDYPFSLRYTLCAQCSTPLGSWGMGSGPALFSPQPGAGQPYNGQTSSLVIVPGRRDAYMLLTDFFDPTSLYNSRQTWVPLTFPTATTVQGRTPAVFDLDLWPEIHRVVR